MGCHLPEPSLRHWSGYEPAADRRRHCKRKKRGCLPISLAALDAQGDAVLLRRYKDTGYAVIYKVTESVLTELFGHPPSLYLPPCTQYLTKKGDVVDAPLIQVDRKDRGSPRK